MFQRENFPRTGSLLLLKSMLVFAVCGVAVFLMRLPQPADGQVAGQEQHFNNLHCANTTHQCDPGTGGDAIVCDDSNLYGHCAANFAENPKDVTCTSLFNGGKCTQTWVYCATWVAGTCSAIPIPDVTNLFFCTSDANPVPFHSVSFAIKCANQ